MWLLYCCVINYTEPPLQLSLTHTFCIVMIVSGFFMVRMCVLYNTRSVTLLWLRVRERDYRNGTSQKGIAKKNEGTTENAQEEEEKNIKKKLSASFFSLPRLCLVSSLTSQKKKKAEHVSKIVSVSEWEKNFSVCSIAGLIQCFVRILGWSMCVVGLAKISLRKKVSYILIKIYT